MTPELSAKIRRLQGPILVLGASSFVGANLLRMLLAVRDDVRGTCLDQPAWRVTGLPDDRVIQTDLLVDVNLDELLDRVRPRSIFNCIGTGAPPSDVDSAVVYETNFNFTVRLLERLKELPISCYVHAGSWHEDRPLPDSDDAVSKVAAATFLRFYGKTKRFPCVNLRLSHGDDACEACVDAALNLAPDHYGESFDIDRHRLSGQTGTEALPAPGLDTKHSVSAIIACYKDGQAIPIMYARLKKTFDDLRVDYEIIFVNDNSPDDSEEVIREISARDRRVIGISHSRNFGSQSAFRSGMEIASKSACVLLDGDLQDPPELIAQFVEKWREGYQVIYGRRVARVAPLFMRVAYKAFYRVFATFAFIPIPPDAGDFSLMDATVVKAILQYPERDLFLRGIRASVGFKQTGVDYVRPQRMFGRTTNSLARNFGWAKKGILSFSYTPLSLLSFVGTVLFLLSLLLSGVQIAYRLLYPGQTPRGLTTVLLAILFFGSFNLLGIATVGEYVAKILEESKRRPHFIRRAMIRGGEVRPLGGPDAT